jgi:hypothetical protein
MPCQMGDVLKVGLVVRRTAEDFMKLFFNPINFWGKTLLVGGLTLAMGGNSLFGQVYSGTLANLAASGGTLSIGDKTFSDFSYSPTGLTAFDPTAITVTASESGGVDYLTWSGTMSLTASTTTVADLVLQYVVTSTGEPIDMIDQSYTGTYENGLLAVDETVATGAFGGTVVAYSDLSTSTPSETEGPTLNVNPAQSVLYVTKDINLLVNSANGGFVTITQVEQSFHQVPEPGTLLFGSLGGGLLLFLKARRQVRRN